MSTCTHVRESETANADEKGAQCPCFKDGTSHQCRARWGQSRPSASELSVFCLRSAYVICPVFTRFNKTGRPLTRWECVVEKLKDECQGYRARSPAMMSFEP
jgi:hypothetical protein